MKAVVLFAMFAALGTVAVAQQPAVSAGVAAMEIQSSGSPAIDPLTLSILQAAACPAGLRASFNSSSQMVKVHKPGDPDAGPSRGPSQHIRISLGNHAQNPVVSVRVTAYGLTARGRIDRSAESSAYGGSNIRRSMEVAQFLSAKDGTLYADLVLPGFTAVNRVKLESMRLADGSTRDFSGKSVCIVPVDPILLVN